jgi:hypothetical protein
MRPAVLLRANAALSLAAILFAGGAARAQNQVRDSHSPDTTLTQSIRDLQEQVEQLRSAVAELRSEAAQYHAENVTLHEHLDALQQKIALPTSNTRESARISDHPPTSSSAQNMAETPSSADQPQPKTPPLQEQLDLLSGKIDDQYQTKVESGSKYRVRLSGLVLFNMFDNRGNVENVDIPQVVTLGAPGRPQTSLGGSLRQSLLGLEVFGPQIAGAKTYGDVQFDFAGGFPQTPNGVTFGLLRLRTATLHFDWANTSVVGGQDGLFFSPLSPTSIASLATPALSYTGNLWSWTPQLRVEHRFSLKANSGITVQAGILDPLTGETPWSSYYFNRQAQSGELSGTPGFASRVAFSTKAFGQPLTVGGGGYYGRQDWGFNRKVDGWVGTTDVTLPLGSRFELSGEFYRGRGIGGLGGALGRSILAAGDLASSNTTVRGLDDMGGWSQLKFKASSKLEFNLAAGQDSSFRNEVLTLPGANYNSWISSNRSALGNFIFRPRSDLLFSAEFARLRTTSIYDYSSANHVSLSMGILF